MYSTFRWSDCVNQFSQQPPQFVPRKMQNGSWDMNPTAYSRPIRLQIQPCVPWLNWLARLLKCPSGPDVEGQGYEGGKYQKETLLSKIKKVVFHTQKSLLNVRYSFSHALSPSCPMHSHTAFCEWGRNVCLLSVI